MRQLDRLVKSILIINGDTAVSNDILDKGAFSLETLSCRVRTNRDCVSENTGTTPLRQKSVFQNLAKNIKSCKQILRQLSTTHRELWTLASRNCAQ